MMWESLPQDAWREHIRPEAQIDPRWINNSRDISNDVCLSRRELFGLILISYLMDNSADETMVGCDPNHDEPNDGFIKAGARMLRIEHKVVVEEDPRDVLTAILSRFEIVRQKGISYGQNRILLIQPNKESSHGGLIKISDLADSIEENCSFDKVLTVTMVSLRDTVGIFHIVQHFPRIPARISEVQFNFATGKAHLSLQQFSL